MTRKNKIKKIPLIFCVLLVLACVLTPCAARAVKFAVMGDTKDFLAGSGAMANAVAKIEKKKVRAVMVVGDLINDCFDDLTCRNFWANWKSTAAPILQKTYPVMGNHDRINSSASAADALWQEVFDLPANGPEGFGELAYSFNKGNSHFVVLNSSKPGNYKVDSVQRTWLDLDLAAARKKKHKFVFFHMPAYPSSIHIGSSLDAYPNERDALWEILDRHDVSAVFVGHEHFFNRRKIDSAVFPGAQNEIYQFTVGRTDVSEIYPAPEAGMSDYYALEESFAIVDAKNKSVKIDLYSATGSRLHSFRYKK